MKILANDGIANSGKILLEKSSHIVITDTVEQNNLIEYINQQNIEVILVRSATTVRKNIIDNCPNLKMIGRGGVGMDNIDVEYARSKGLLVFNTPAASSQSVAELVMAQLFSLSRMAYDANKTMPTIGARDFKKLKKKYSKGIELRGKTIGIVGFGRIGQSIAQYAIGCGMNVMAHDPFVKNAEIKIPLQGKEFTISIDTVSFDTLISSADFISLHIPKQENGTAVIGAAEFLKMKKGVYIVNAARGGVIDETELIEALNNSIVAGCALDVFENEPNPNPIVLSHPKITSTPHIGAATLEAQDRIGEELANFIITNYSK